MEVAVANGAWRHGSILSIRVGEMRRQAPLQTDTRIAFASTREDVDHMQVDVFARVGSARLSLQPEQEVYDLNIEGEGFAGLALRVRQPMLEDQAAMMQAQIEPAGPVAQPISDIASTAAPTGADDALSEAPSRQPVAQQSDRPSSGRSSLAEERIHRVRQDATSYMERFDLRMVMQDMFQQVIKERPDDPFNFMQNYLRDGPAKRFADILPPHAASASGAAQPVLSPSAISVKDERPNVASVEADALEEDRRAERELMLVREHEAQRAEILFLSHQVKELEKALQQKEASASDAANKAAEFPALQTQYQAEIDSHKQLIVRQQTQHQTEIDSHKQQIVSQQSQIDMQQSHIDGQQSRIASLEQRVKDAEDMATSRSLQEMPPNYGRATPGDEAAGGGQPLQDKTVGLQGYNQYRTMQPSTSSLDAEAAGIMAQSVSGQHFSSGSAQNWASGSAALSTSAGTEVNTHMLSQLLASTYAAPVPPVTYFEPREDKNEDLLPPHGVPQKDPAILVDIVECADKTTNGTFAWIGTCNKRPLYRLLAPEPRYLYYAEVDPAWAGWWVADKMGSEGYVEWFRDPADAKLPVYCRRGELGSRVVEAELTREVALKISKITNLGEKTTIRSKLTEVFGAHFTKMEGSQRGLMSKTSPVVGVAHALEAQQRAIQLLHSQLGAESQRREAAEAHAQTMEEAFETLQLRIQAKLPGTAPLVAGHRFKGADDLLSSVAETEIASLSIS
mmetsp:Transcript_116928/g.214982  ORF Transcript_116928/g.214982 Transcript_116928/m.214982 type:complete len:736 (-) Transcript_116928:93-2300(-)